MRGQHEREVSEKNTNWREHCGQYLAAGAWWEVVRYRPPIFCSARQDVWYPDAVRVSCHPGWAPTNANPAQVAEAVRVNTEARLRALKIGLLILAAVSAIAIFPASRLPNYTPGEIPPAGRGREMR